MIVLLHVLAALSSIAFTTYLFVRPSRRKFYVAYGLVALTLISGTYLTLSRPAHILQTCASGLLYIVFVSAGLAAAHFRLVARSH